LDVSVLWSVPWVAALAAAVVALGIGVWLGRRSSRDLREQCRDLEGRLQIAEEDMTRYRGQVSEHFAETSQLLRDLTLQYRTVYEHLAEGARVLCPDGATLLAPSLAEAALPEAASDAPAPADETQLDLGLRPSGSWTAGEEARVGEELGPLLDEEVEGTRDDGGGIRAADVAAR
jgi:uncharacterized membrane-anchored protein YhcB (DUF1043 family)